MRPNVAFFYFLLSVDHINAGWEFSYKALRKSYIKNVNEDQRGRNMKFMRRKKLLFDKIKRLYKKHNKNNQLPVLLGVKKLLCSEALVVKIMSDFLQVLHVCAVVYI